jgi:hypothetical protein
MWSLDGLAGYLRDHTTAGGVEIEELYPHVQQMYGQAVLEDDFSIVRLDFE